VHSPPVPLTTAPTEPSPATVASTTAPTPTPPSTDPTTTPIPSSTATPPSSTPTTMRFGLKNYGPPAPIWAKGTNPMLFYWTDCNTTLTSSTQPHGHLVDAATDTRGTSYNRRCSTTSPGHGRRCHCESRQPGYGPGSPRRIARCKGGAPY
jgi:hypothetical protein